MALNHTHDTLDTSLKDETKNKTTKSATKITNSTEEAVKENHDDLLDGRTLLEAEALLIMLITRMKIKGNVK